VEISDREVEMLKFVGEQSRAGETYTIETPARVWTMRRVTEKALEVRIEGKNGSQQ
jgi:hypothetical protein